MRLWNTTPRIFKGRNSNGMEFPLGWGSTAVPAAGSCAGVKKETPVAGTLAGDMFSKDFLRKRSTFSTFGTLPGRNFAIRDDYCRSVM
jgi:hypothetical protein